MTSARSQTSLITAQSKFNGNLHWVVEGRVLVVEPQNAVVGLRVDTQLPKLADLLFLARQQIQLQHFQERIAILRRELDREVQIVLCVLVTEHFSVGWAVHHGKTSAFAPHLT